MAATPTLVLSCLLPDGHSCPPIPNLSWYNKYQNNKASLGDMKALTCIVFKLHVIYLGPNSCYSV